MRNFIQLPDAARRTTWRRYGVVLAISAMLLVAGCGTTTSPRSSQQPNIVFIMADDLGYADLACYGRPDIRTPNIDRLAANGVRFLQAYANSAVCSASRTAIITGRYQYRLRVGLEEPISGRAPDPGLPPSHPTLPSLLKRLGYATALVGKWHLGALPEYGPLQSGYDHFYGFRGGAMDYFSHRGGLWNDDTPVQEEGYLTRLLGERAVKTVNEYAKAGRPFLLSLHFNAPHWPWEGPDDQAESARLMQPGANIFHSDGGSQKTYGEMIVAMDQQIGRVIAALEANGIRDNTIVIFTSDNGGERFAFNWPFSGRKTELLEGGIRVPAIVSWPARLPRGRSSQQVAMGMDWLPTLLAAAGGAPDPQYPTDGMNLLPHLQDNAAPVERTVFWRYKANGQRAARQGDYKYLRIRENTFLFDVAADPLERGNLKVRQQETYQRLAKEWFDWNATMLPEIAESYTHAINAAEAADRYGATEPDGKPDIPVAPDR